MTDKERAPSRPRNLRAPKFGVCERCGRPFVGQRSKRFCRTQCAALAWAQSQRAANPKQRGDTPGRCLLCLSPFRGFVTKRFCSRKCAQKWLRLTDSAARARNRASSREYRRHHPDKERARRERDREQIRDRVRRWRQLNPEKPREYSARYRRKYRERTLALVRKYHQLHAESRRAASAEWQKKNPDRHAFISANRRARELKAPGSHTYGEWRAMVELFDSCCAYCGLRGPLTRDHVIPLARGGSNSIDNIVPSCRKCNARKNVVTRDEFRARVAMEWLAS